MTQLPDGEDSHESLLRTYVWAGTAIFSVTVIAIVVVLSLHQSDALVKLVLALTPTFASAVGIVTTAVLNGRLRNDQKGLKSQVATVSDKVSTVEHQTNGTLSPRIEGVVRKVLNDKNIQHQVAGHLADVLVERAVPQIVNANQTPADTGTTGGSESQPSGQQSSGGSPTGNT